MSETLNTVMEESMASLTISSPPRDPFDGYEPYSAERFDVDAGFKTFFAMCEKLKSTVFYPVTIPVMGTQIPGTDCFRHNTVQGRRDKMVDFYPMALAYFNKKYVLKLHAKATARYALKGLLLIRHLSKVA